MSNLSPDPQPLDSLIKALGLDNHDLVQASEEQLTHKMVAKGRKGRFLTFRTQMKIVRALNTAANKSFTLSQLFTYEGR